MRAANGAVIRQVLHQTTAEFEKAHRRYGSPPLWLTAICGGLSFADKLYIGNKNFLKVSVFGFLFVLYMTGQLSVLLGKGVICIE